MLAAVTFDAGTGALVVTGNATDDTIALVGNADSQGFTVNVNNDAALTQSFSYSDVTSLTVYALGGNDTVTNTLLIGTDIRGGDGNDQLHGSSADDFIYGGNGEDTIWGGLGIDRIYGQNDKDTLYGDGGVDYLYGGDGVDTVNGNAGDDFLHGGAGNDTLNGQDGNDRLEGGLGSDRLFGHDGEDRLFGSAGVDYLYGGDDNDTVYGNDGNDFLQGGAGNDLLGGQEGNDRLEGGLGSDRLYGNNGEDRLFGNEGVDYLYGGGDGDTLYGNAGNDFLHGGAGDDLLGGNEGDDRLEGGLDNDRLLGHSGEDRLFGSEGVDHLYGGDDADILYGNAGNDFLYGGTGNDVLGGNEGDDLLDAGDDQDIDRLTGGSGLDQFVVVGDIGSTSVDVVNDRVGIETYNGYTGPLTVQVEVEGDKLVVHGLPTDDKFHIYRENDQEEFELRSDHDFVGRYTTSDFSEVIINTGAGDDFVHNVNSIVSLRVDGGSGEDIIHGGRGDDFIRGGDGNDRIYGYEGNDILSGNEGDDIIYGHGGEDEINGGLGNDKAWGGSDDDFLGGNDGNDELHGDSGDDILRGDAGADELHGGSGADTFFADDADDIQDERSEDTVEERVYLGSIGDLVFVDANGNGVLNSGETGLEGAVVTLFQGDTAIGTRTTDSNGQYSFDGLETGSYRVELGDANLFDYEVTTASSFDVVLGDDEVNTSVDFGAQELPPGTASIGDLVFEDLNGNVAFDSGELGIEGATVRLLRGSTEIAVTNTDAAGQYSFDNLREGSYQVELVSSSIEGLEITTAESFDVTLSDEEQNDSIDFGVMTPEVTQEDLATALLTSVSAGLLGHLTNSQFLSYLSGLGARANRVTDGQVEIVTAGFRKQVFQKVPLGFTEVFDYVGDYPSYLPDTLASDLVAQRVPGVSTIHLVQAVSLGPIVGAGLPGAAIAAIRLNDGGAELVGELDFTIDSGLVTSPVGIPLDPVGAVGFYDQLFDYAGGALESLGELFTGTLSNVGLGEEERQQLFDFITELSSFEVRRLQLFEAIKASKLDLLLDPTDPTKKFFFDDIPGTVNEVRLGGPGDPTAKPVVTCGTGRFDCDDYVEAGVNFLNASKGEFGGVLENAVITAYQGSFFKQQSVIVEGQNQLPILEVKNFGDRKHAVVLITLGSGEHYAWNADDLYLSKATLTAEQAVEDAIWGAGRTLPRNPVTDVKPFIRPPVASGSPDAFSFQDDLGFRTLFTEAQLEQQQTPANIEKFFTRPAPSGE